MKRKSCCVASYAEGYKDGVLEQEPYMYCWTDIKNKLPLYKQVILVFLDEENIVEAVYRGKYETDMHCFRIELTREDILCQIGERITHWMDLPKVNK